MVNISMIIPVFNASDYLPILFRCLEQCNLTIDDEVILIDNGSTDDSKNICKEYIQKSSINFRYFYFDDVASSYAARNFGVKQSVNDILVFTDSDCIPQKNWIDEIKNNISDNIVLGGKVQINIEDDKNIWEIYDFLAHLDSEKNIKNKCIATANMAVTKKDFYIVGWFSERFSGADYEWSKRASKKGLFVKYLEQAIVLHPSRKSFGIILNKERRISYGKGQEWKKKNKKLFFLIILYLLKILKLDTNFRYTKSLITRKIKIRDILIFNIKFIQIRVNHLLFVNYGFHGVDVRTLKIK
ncbi:MAG: glycosyltransferase [Thomasclavelia sp.]